MVERNILLPTIEMFKPTPGGEYSPNEMVLFRNFFGAEGLSVCERLRNGETNITPELEHRVKDAFYAGIKRTYQLEGVDPKRFYQDHYRSANVIIQNQQTRLFKEFGTRPELKDEAVRPDNPIRTLRRLASVGNIDPQLSYEIKRGLLLTHILCMQDAHLRNNGINMDDEMNDVLEVFNTHLYTGTEGEGVYQPVFAIHDNETNRVTDVVNNPIDYIHNLSGQHIKRHPKVMRFVPEIGRVLTSSRVKEKQSSLIKSISKAANNGGIIKPITDVQDHFGLRFAVEDPRVDVKLLERKVIDALSKHPDRRILRIDPDHKPQSDRGQSATIEFRRLQVYLSELPPLELMFYTMKDSLNTEFDVGTRNPDTGVYTGDAHELFELRRLMDVLPIIFPYEIYRINTTKVLAEQMESVVQRLKPIHTMSAPVMVK